MAATGFQTATEPARAKDAAMRRIGLRIIGFWRMDAALVMMLSSHTLLCGSAKARQVDVRPFVSGRDAHGIPPPSASPLDHAPIHAGRPIAHAAAGDDAVRRDVQKRHEHEGALSETRMRDREPRLVDDAVVVSQDVYIDHARTPALASFPSKLGLDPLDRIQKAARRERGLSGGAGVHEVGLIRLAPGWSAVERRARRDAHAPGLKPPQRGLN